MLYFKYMVFSATCQSLPRKMTYHFKSNAIKKSTHSEASKKQSGTNCNLRYASRDDDERSCPGTAVHASGISKSILSPFVPASEKCGQDRKNTTVESRQTVDTTGKTSKTVRAKNIYLFRKVMISLLNDPGRTACFARSKPSLVAVGQLAVVQTPRKRRIVLSKLSLRRCRLFRRLIETEYTPAPGL